MENTNPEINAPTFRKNPLIVSVCPTVNFKRNGKTMKLVEHIVVYMPSPYDINNSLRRGCSLIFSVA